MVIRVALVVLMLVASSGYSHKLRSARRVVGEFPPLGDIPTELGGWWSEEFPITDVERSVLVADTTLNRRYRRPDGTSAWLFVAYFAQQRVNSQIHSPRNCLPGSGWRVESAGETRFEIAGQPRVTSRMSIARDESRQSVYYWFQTRAGRIAGEYALKIDLVRNALAGRPTDAAFVRIVSNEREAVEELMELLDEPLGRVLGEVGL